MLRSDDIIFGIAMPIVLSAIIMIVSRRLGQPAGAIFIANRGAGGVKWGGSGRSVWGAVAIGLSYLVAHVGVQGWPTFPPVPVEHGLFWIALIVLAGAIALEVAHAREVGRGVFVGLAIVASVWLITRRMWHEDVARWTAWQGAMWVGVLSIGAALHVLFVGALARSADCDNELVGSAQRGSRLAEFDMPFVLSGVIGLGGLLVTLNGKFLALGILSGAVALSLLVCAGVALFAKGASIARGGQLVAGVLGLMIWLDACLWGEFEYGYAVVLAMAPACAAGATLVLPREAPGLARTIAKVIGAAGPIGLLVAIEIAKFAAEQA